MSQANGNKHTQHIAKKPAMIFVAVQYCHYSVRYEISIQKSNVTSDNYQVTRNAQKGCSYYRSECSLVL